MGELSVATETIVLIRSDPNPNAEMRNEGARMLITLYIDFRHSRAANSAVGGGTIYSNSSKIIIWKAQGVPQ